MKINKSFFLLRLGSTTLDLGTIYSLAILLQALFLKFIFVKFNTLFIVVFLLYYFLSYVILSGRTPTKYLTGLKVVKNNEVRIPLINIIARELILKGFVGIIIPTYILEFFFPFWSAFLTMIILAVLLLLSSIAVFIFKNTWWEQLSKTKTIKTEKTSLKVLNYSFFLITLVFLTATSLIIYPFLKGEEDIKISLAPSYPVSKETKLYSDYIQKHAQNPVDYIFDLFDKYDIVVISERMHPEYTQYELIFKIINDPRFTNKVGNIFTECGSVSFQDTLHSYLHTHFENENSLNRSTADLQRNSNGVWPLWDNTNLFDLLKTVNKLNNTLVDSLKVNWYFADQPVNWETMTHDKYIKGYTNPDRDSVMADNIIKKYNSIINKQNRKKALVIMNTRHGYGLIKKSLNRKTRFENDNTTVYLMKAYPGKVSNVMLNTVTLKYGFLFTPVQNGKWETAFSYLDNPNVGFDFAGSPFGDDKFDLAAATTPSLTYKDVFTGFIFYKPLTQHFEKRGFPFEFENFEDSILRRSAFVSSSHVEIMKKMIALYKQNPKDPFFEEPLKYGLLYNLFRIVLAPLLLFLSYLIGLIFYIKLIKVK